jgi:hypothetical protein
VLHWEGFSPGIQALSYRKERDTAMEEALVQNERGRFYIMALSPRRGLMARNDGRTALVTDYLWYGLL